MLHFLVASTLCAASIFGSKVSNNKLAVENPEFSATFGRIINGTEIPIERVPYQVSLGDYNQTAGVYNRWCGGSIISEKWVLTAAHCNPKRNHLITAGIADIKKIFNSRMNRKIRQVFSHPYYVYGYMNTTINDIALILLDKPFIFSREVQPVELFEQDEETPEGSRASVSGWGATGDSNISPDILRRIKVPIIGKYECNVAYHGKISYKGHICGGYLKKGHKASCRGDSGGPVTVNKRLAGIVSWGPGDCAVPGIPSVYTEVAYYRNWIDGIINTFG